ncbi:MAG: hypothetical protein ACRC1K_07405 [Planctomycetia bacterium]
MIVNVGPHDVARADKARPELHDRLGDCQRDAAAGVYASCLSAFVRWLAPRVEELRHHWKSLVAERRSSLPTAAGHARTATTAADFSLAFDLLLKFAGETGAVADTAGESLRRRFAVALESLAAEQIAATRDTDPATEFVRLLRAALAGGRCHLADVHSDSSPPVHGERCGWRPNIHGEWQPLGHRVGYVDGVRVLLIADTTYAAVQSLARDQGTALALTPRTIGKRLFEKGWLTGTSAKDRNQVQVEVRGSRTYFLALSIAPLFGEPKKPNEPPPPATPSVSPPKSLFH